MATTYLLALPTELVLKCITHAATYSNTDAYTLRALMGVCKDLTTLVRTHRKDIMEAYTSRINRGSHTCYEFCGKLHRGDDLPAVVGHNGEKHWYWMGLPHRDDDKPAIVRPCGTREWY